MNEVLLNDTRSALTYALNVAKAGKLTMSPEEMAGVIKNLQQCGQVLAALPENGAIVDLATESPSDLTEEAKEILDA